MSRRILKGRKPVPGSGGRLKSGHPFRTGGLSCEHIRAGTLLPVCWRKGFLFGNPVSLDNISNERLPRTVRHPG